MSRVPLDLMMRDADDMHIVEQPAQGLQRRLHGLLEHMLGPETLSLEAVRQALDPAQVAGGTEPRSREAAELMLEPARMVLGTEPVALGLVRPVSTLSGWCQASWRSRSTPWPPCKAARLWCTAPRGSGGELFDRRSTATVGGVRGGSRGGASGGRHPRAPSGVVSGEPAHEISGYAFSGSTPSSPMACCARPRSTAPQRESR